MDSGYLVIGIFVGLIGFAIWGWKTPWNGKHDGYKHTALKGHRQEGSSGGDDG